MNRDTVIYCICTFLLGLVIGALLIGPHLGKAPPAPQPAERTGSDPMPAVRQQLAILKEQVARDPQNATALVQLGNMYMDAVKYPEAIDYYERALAVREDSGVRIDVGICYKNSGQLEKALAAFRRANTESPGQWQPLYNEAIVLGEMRRFEEARPLVARLRKMRPDDPEVARLEQALSTAK